MQGGRASGKRAPTYERGAGSTPYGLGGHRRRPPELVDGPFGVGAALAGERNKFGHGRIDLSQRQFGDDEAGLEAGEGETVGQPELRVVPAIARGPRRVSATASSEHDELAAAEQALATFEVD